VGLAVPKHAGLSAPIQTGVPGPLGSTANLGTSIAGLWNGVPYSWRMRSLSRSVHFPTSKWFSPTRSGAREVDLKNPGSWVAVEGGPAPKTVALSASHPNPSPGRSAVSLALSRKGTVSLDVVDVQGRVVCTLLDGEREAGRYTASWDGRGASGADSPSGVYFYRLAAEGQRLTRKVVLIR
jgi:hypothetical protein